MNTKSLALLVVMGVLAVLAEESEPTSPFFSQTVTSLPQLIAQQELQRRYADVMLGLSQSSQWQAYSAIEGRKYQLSQKTAPSAATSFEQDSDVKVVDEDDDDVSLLELKSTTTPFSPLMAPFLGDNTNINEFSVADLELKSTTAKLTALKHLQLQLYLVTSDVEKTYWVNKILTPLLPQQLMYFKVYKQFLTTTALSLAYQLHDSFTLEGYLDNFNDQYFVGGKTDLSEANAELNLYVQWHSLASTKMQLFYLSMYEQSMTTRLQAMAAGNAFQSASSSSFLELDEQLKAEPASPFVGSNDAASTLQRYNFMTQYVSFLRMYIMYSELTLSSAGLNAAHSKQTGLIYKYDSKAENDAESVKLLSQAEELEGKYLPSLYGQWAQLTTMKYYLELSLLYSDSQMPQLALARAPQRADAALQDLNLVQTEATTTTA